MNTPESKKPLDEYSGDRIIVKRFNNLYFGLFIGVFVAPFIGFWIFYLLAISRQYAAEMSIREYVDLATNSADTFSKIVAFSCIPNLLAFFLLLKKDKDTAARGVIFATLMYVFFVIILKFF